MDFEAPADAWYVWLGVSIASVAIGGVVLGLPTGPPPDANGTANAIDRTAGSPYEAATTQPIAADEVKFGPKTIAMRNEHGVAHASIAHGELVVVTGDERLENLTYGTRYQDEFEYERNRGADRAAEAFADHVEDAHRTTAHTWREPRSELVVRKVPITDSDDLSASTTARLESTDGIHIDETGMIHATLIIV